MGVYEAEPFFFQQTVFKKREKRLKKHPDDLPQDLRFAHLNPRVAAYLASKEKDIQRDETVFNDGLGSKSLLPQISQTVTLLKSKLDSFLNNEDQARFNFQEAKVRAEALLKHLQRLLVFFEGTRVNLPRSVQHELAAQYKDLIVHAIHVKREWQNPSNKAFYFAKKAQEEMQKQEDGLRQPSLQLTSDARGSTADPDDGIESSVDARSSRAGYKSRNSRKEPTLENVPEKKNASKFPRNLESKEKPLENPKAKARLDKYQSSLANTDYKATDNKSQSWSEYRNFGSILLYG